MCFAKGKNWNDLDPQYKNGTLFFRGLPGEVLGYTSFNLMNDDFCKGLFEQFLYPE